MAFFEDLFGGGGGSQNQGQPSTAGAGDGGKAITINRALDAITGAYSVITGAGQKNGPAPAPAAVSAPKTQASWMPYAIGAAAVAVIAFVFFKR